MNRLLASAAPLLLADFAVVIVAAALTGYLCQRAGIVPIFGHLLAGVIVGPYAAGLISDRDLVEQTAEIGVVFLMFSIGLELSGDTLRRVYKDIQNLHIGVYPPMGACV